MCNFQVGTDSNGRYATAAVAGFPIDRETTAIIRTYIREKLAAR